MSCVIGHTARRTAVQLYSVHGGTNIWTSVVEAHLQLHKSDVMVSIDLQNCFNEIDRDTERKH